MIKLDKFFWDNKMKAEEFKKDSDKVKKMFYEFNADKKKEQIDSEWATFENFVKVVSDEEFGTHCLRITLLSQLLECYGHLFTTLPASCCSKIFFIDPKFIVLLIFLSQMSDAGGLFVGSLIGKNPFAHSISPNKTV